MTDSDGKEPGAPGDGRGRQADQNERTKLHASGPTDDDGHDEPTRFRDRPSTDDEDDSTRLRDREDSGDEDESTLFRSTGQGSDEIEPTELSADGDAPKDLSDSGEVDVRFVTRRAEGDEEDTTRLRNRAEGDDDEDEATRFRGPSSAGDDEDEATRFRASTEPPPGDDDPTVTAGVDDGRVDDDDPTIQVAGGDDDATIQTGTPPGSTAGGDAATGDDADATAVGAHISDPGDDDPTVQGSQPQTGMPAASAAAPSALGAGTVLKGRFVLEDKLGEGGMGGVYKAVDLVKQEARDRNPHVAVKVLNENFAEHPDAFIALQRESSRTQRLSHPSIASVYDFDRDGQTAYMVMELMQGDPLDKFLKRHKEGVQKEQAFSIIRDISSALAYAHAQGLIHSDFKPGNIFLTAAGSAKVFDFGIARAAAVPGEEKQAQRGPISEDTLSGDDGSDKTLFDAGQLGALTPAYATYEMFEGKDPAPQDDVYALGIVAYQLLTGKHPYDRKKAPIAEAQEMVPERPEGLTRREWNALRRSLAFRREDRTPDAQAFLDEFFGIAGTGIRNALLGATGVAAVVAGLYIGGVIGPGAAAIEVPREWVELDTRIENARSSVEEQLATPIFSAIWEEFVQRDIRRWAEAAAPLVVAGSFPNENEAETVRRRVFEQHDLPLRVERPASEGGQYRLIAGPFAGDNVERQLEDYTSRLRDAGLDPVTRSDHQAIARARDQALGIYLEEVRRLMPESDPPAIPTILDEDRYVADPDRLETARTQVAAMREAGEVLNRAEQRYPTRPEEIAELQASLQETRTRWQNHIDEAIATASGRQAQEERQELLAEQRRQAELERQRAYEAMRDDRVFPIFAGRCHQPGEVREVLDSFERLTDDDRQEALRYAADCASNRVNRSPTEVMQSRNLILAVVDYPALAAVEPPDPCSSRSYIGNGRTAICMDDLADGGSAPGIVVIPGNDTGIYGIGKYEVSVAEFNRFCEATNCGTPARGSGRLPATGIPAEAAERYTEWLTEQTGFVYRLPTEAEWRRAAHADGSALDSNRNCYSNVRGVIRGESLVAVTQGAPNAWGLINHVGNAQEWATTDGGGLVAVGGKHTDPLSECTLDTRGRHEGSGDSVTGFRVLREIN